MTIEKFLSKKYEIHIKPYEYEQEEYVESGWVITCPDLLGISVFGETISEALEELTEAKIAWYELKQELGEEIE